MDQPTTALVMGDHADAKQVAVGGLPQLHTGDAPPVSGQCWICHHDSTDCGGLFLPCKCESPVHRECFRRWRAGWINPHNYFQCPICKSDYRIERVRDSEQTRRRILRQYQLDLLKLWMGIIAAIVIFVGGIAGIAYASDTSDKNVPVAIKYLLTSVAGGGPPPNATAQWSMEFKQPTVHVWPYYTAFAALITSILVLTVFIAAGATFNESQRNGSTHCHCTGGNVCLCPGGCDCRHSGGGGGGGSDMGSVIAVLLLIIILVVLISALCVIIGFAVSRCTLLYDRVTHMLRSQLEELEGDTIVLGRGEYLRPADVV